MGVVYVSVCACASKSKCLLSACVIVLEEERRRTEQGHHAGARPAQITTVGPGRVILGTRLPVQVIPAADTVHRENQISGRAAAFLQCADEVNPGKSYYVLLMSVIKSKPIKTET